MLDATEEALVRNATRSGRTKTTDENGIEFLFYNIHLFILVNLDDHLHPSEMNVLEESIILPGLFFFLIFI
jgi:hypothetical protein